MKSDIVIYPHNREAYKKVCEAFRHTNKTCVIQPTGTGKMYIAMQLIDDNIEKKILYLTSYNPILLALATEMKKCGVVSKNLTNALYCNLDVNLCVAHYDYIIMDEFHRAGAQIWGRYVTLLLENNPQAKILGLSATPIRHLDDSRDMSDELFDGNIASHMSLAEAVGRKIIQMPRYICTIFSMQKILESYEQKARNEKSKKKRKQVDKLLEKARRSLEQSVGLEEIFLKNIHVKNGHYIVFCRNYEHMNSMKLECAKWLYHVNPNIEIYEIKAVNTWIANENTIHRFVADDSDKIKLLFTVDMLNEGMHLEAIDGCIMLRPTESANVFIQQFGRIISSSAKTKTSVFDIVNNITQITAFNGFVEEVKRVAAKYGTDIDLDDFYIAESIREFRDALIQIDNLLMPKSWEESYAIAKEYQEKNGNLEVTINYCTPDGYGLGQWIKRQRMGRRRGILSAERIALLDKIHMNWNPSKVLTWEESYKLAEAYYHKNRNLDIPRRYKTEDGYNLGRWINEQRKAKSAEKLSVTQIALLDKINMVWDAIDDLTWDEAYKNAVAYREANGHLRVPLSYETPEGHKLGIWIRTQRKTKNCGKLSEERIVLLDKIGMIWRERPKQKRLPWNEMYELAKKYHKENGNLKIPIAYKTPDGYNLGIWIRTQQEAKNDGKLSEERIVLLDKIGMIWRERLKQKPLPWNEMYELAKKFHKENGNLKILATYKTPDGYKLGGWIRTQRRTNKSGKLSKEKIALLNNIDMIW